MATAKKRINISVNDVEQKLISELALRDKVPTATKASELINRALELEEDIALDQLAQSRDQKDTKYHSHNSVWKQNG